ncbi:hypothetical protein GCM10008983_19680 [Lentibacillus halophilus]|uniref:RNA polymerase subunit sigma-70 n=1 Tax=Lentibacillus halophilus TaxID=295065 RepID=A0ABP3J8Y2_9BACI
MRVNEKQWNAVVSKSIYGADFHRFMEMEDQSHHMDIAEELGINLGEVKRLKKKITRS